MLIEAIRLDPSTRALIIAPERPSRQWFKELVSNPLFNLISLWAKGADMYTSAPGTDLFDSEGRQSYRQGAPEATTAWEMTSGPTKYTPLCYEKAAMAKDFNLALIPSMEAELRELKEVAEAKAAASKWRSLSFPCNKPVECPVCKKVMIKRGMATHLK